MNKTEYDIALDNCSVLIKLIDFGEAIATNYEVKNNLIEYTGIKVIDADELKKNLGMSTTSPDGIVYNENLEKVDIIEAKAFTNSISECIEALDKESNIELSKEINKNIDNLISSVKAGQKLFNDNLGSLECDEVRAIYFYRNDSKRIINFHFKNNDINEEDEEEIERNILRLVYNYMERIEDKIYDSNDFPIMEIITSVYDYVKSHKK